MNEEYDFHFPKNFLWGASTSAHQVEGDNHNQWTQWEQKNAVRLAQEAPQKFPFLPEKLRQEATGPQNYISGKACDHFRRYREDFDLMKSLGMNAYRFSIEWSRIEPEKGVFDAEALRHYCEMIRELHTRNIEPLITLWHWTVPCWFFAAGDFTAENSAKLFARYTEYVLRGFQKEKLALKLFITLNEPEVYVANSYLRGEWPPQQRNFFAARKVRQNLLAAHHAAYEMIKSMVPEAQVGIAHALAYMEPYKHTFLNRMAAKIAEYFWNESFLRHTVHTEDFLGLNYYFRTLISWHGTKHDATRPRSDLNWELHPKGIEFLLRLLKKYEKPIYITENGLADYDDSRRGEYIEKVLAALARAIQAGVPVRGYLHWSLLDNFEWDKGFWARFGLIEIDHTKNLERRVRPSALKYAEIIRKGGVSGQQF